MTSYFGSHHHDIGKEEHHASKEQISKIHTKNSFEDYRNETAKSWIKLPDSVNGTLIYFLLVENNNIDIEMWDLVKCFIHVGGPVWYTFYMQFLLLFTVYGSIPNFSEHYGNNIICVETDYHVQWAVIAIFMIFLIPSLRSIYREFLIIMKSREVAFQNPDDEERYIVYVLKNSDIKKYIALFTVVLPETLVLLILLYVGSGFILTSKDIGTIIINSVAIAFIMDIDNFSGEAFQTEVVSERAYGTLWHTDVKNDDFKFTDGIPQGFDLEILASFNNVKKVVLVMISSWVTIFCIREFYCY